ncbi:MAG: DUF362 domain-containing protein [Planctomycetes bacterium]|nr:DUF362 domain-containing protein [Planctomycetota bacterium]
MRSKIAVLKTTPATVLDDYRKLMRLADYKNTLSPDQDTIIKLNLSWTRYFPACSSQPWQLAGVVQTLLADGFARERLFPLENKTVVTDPIKGAQNNRWLPVLDKYNLAFTPLTEVKWVKYQFKHNLLMLDKIFPDGIEIPEMFIGKNIIHLPTVKTHGHTVTTGAIKNSFGGLLKEARHYAHKHIHEVLVDLMIMQQELHPGIFSVMDGTVCGDGAGPRTMVPVIKDYILAGADSVALDAVAAKMMGFDPLKIDYLRICNEMGLGNAEMKNIEIVGADISGVDFGFRTRKSLVIWGDQLLRQGGLKTIGKIALHPALMGWAPLASNLYHDFLWYPLIGKHRISKFMETEWGKLFREY